VSREISLPAFAIGGVTLDRLDELAALGITRVAVAAAVTGARDPAAAAAAIIDRLKQRVENGDGSDFPSPAY
jgi:thiamine-phosphate pyrophosphorylase